MVTKINAKTFNGTGNVHNGTLAKALHAVAAAHSRRIVSSLADITDSSGGTPAAGIVAAPAPANFQEAGTASVQKAELEASFTAIRSAISELIAQANVIRAKVPAFNALTDSTGGAAADGTIGAIDASMTAVNTSIASAVGARTVIGNINARISQLTYFVNQLRQALGMSKLANALTEGKSYSTTFAALSVGTGTAVSGADATNANAGTAKAAMDPCLVKIAANIATLAAALNAMTADANANAAMDVVFVG